MLYAATRTTLTKSLGSAHFTDNIFATSKDDIGAGAYAKHKRHIAAPPPMSAREKEMEAVKAAEREAGGRIYEGSRARQSHVGQGVGLNWTDEAANAIKELGAAEDSRLVVLVRVPVANCDACAYLMSERSRLIPLRNPCCSPLRRRLTSLASAARFRPPTLVRMMHRVHVH